MSGTTTQNRPRPVAVEPRDGYRIWLRYNDGVEGEVDLSDNAGKGVFAAWLDRDFFEGVRIGEWGEIVWGEDLDLCPDALYLQLTGKSPDDIWPALRADRSQASGTAPPAGEGTAPGPRGAAAETKGAANMTSPNEPDPFRPMAVEPREGYRIWLRYADGAEGEVDLSHLVGKGVFAAWRDRGFFERVHIGGGGAIAWSDQIDICPDSLYQRLTGRFPEEVSSGPNA